MSAFSLKSKGVDGGFTTGRGSSVNLTVNFPSGSADLTPAARASLDNLGKALSSSELANFRFRIEGHTDNVGSPEENKALSQRRAEAVVSYLTSQYNVAPSRLEAVGMGEEDPVVQAPPQTPEARNRRGSGHQPGRLMLVGLALLPVIPRWAIIDPLRVSRSLHPRGSSGGRGCVIRRDPGSNFIHGNARMPPPVDDDATIRMTPPGPPGRSRPALRRVRIHRAFRRVGVRPALRYGVSRCSLRLRWWHWPADGCGGRRSLAPPRHHRW